MNILVMIQWNVPDEMIEMKRTDLGAEADGPGIETWTISIFLVNKEVKVKFRPPLITNTIIIYVAVSESLTSLLQGRRDTDGQISIEALGPFFAVTCKLYANWPFLYLSGLHLNWGRRRTVGQYEVYLGSVVSTVPISDAHWLVALILPGIGSVKLSK